MGLKVIFMNEILVLLGEYFTTVDSVWFNMRMTKFFYFNFLLINKNK